MCFDIFLRCSLHTGQHTKSHIIFFFSLFSLFPYCTCSISINTHQDTFPLLFGARQPTNAPIDGGKLHTTKNMWMCYNSNNFLLFTGPKLVVFFGRCAQIFASHRSCMGRLSFIHFSIFCTFLNACNTHTYSMAIKQNGCCCVCEASSVQYTEAAKIMMTNTTTSPMGKSQ